jgi:hypothetical protein
MRSTELLQEATKITEANVSFVKEHVLPLSEEQKNWKKDQISWSINEIFAHLNSYAAYYHKTMLRKIEKTRFRTPRENFISSPLGRSAWRSMKLGNLQNVKRKMKSARTYNPSYTPELLSGSVVQQFEKEQDDLLRIIRSAAEINIRKAKIPISISKIIRLRLGDALLFVVYHNERHVQQVKNVLTHPKFPSN